MSDVNEEMKATADYAIKSAKERYGLDLDYSEESLAVLDNILEKIYWGFSSHTRDEGEGGLVYNTAIIWGSYLGEYMCLKWGGTWTVNGSDRRVSITSIEFSPISLVFQKITNHPEYSVENYVKETKKVIYTSVIHPKKSQYVAESVGQPKEPAPSKPVKTKAPVSINRSVIYIGGGILALMVVAAACIFGYSIIKAGGFPAFGLFADITSTSTNTPEPTNTATLAFTATPSPTVTDLPTYTPKPTDTPLPTYTPTLTFTPLPSETPTETPYPTDTEIPYRSPTPTTRPSNTPTERPVHPSDTPLPPITLESCSVSPSTVDRDTNTQLTLSVRFSRSTPGYGFTAVMSGGYPGQSGCSGTDNGSGTASCEGTSGQLPGLTTVRVTFSTDVGDCVDSYSSR